MSEENRLRNMSEENRLRNMSTVEDMLRLILNEIKDIRKQLYKPPLACSYIIITNEDDYEYVKDYLENIEHFKCMISTKSFAGKVYIYVRFCCRVPIELNNVEYMRCKRTPKQNAEFIQSKGALLNITNGQHLYVE